MSYQPTLPGFDSAIFLRESEDGATRCDSPGGLTTGLCGPDRALASLSARQALERGLMTKGTYGPPSGGSLTSAALQSCLASRLHRRLDADGSPEFDLTWKEWAMESGPPICALRASVRRTSGSGCSGWPTPNCPNGGRSITHVHEWRGSTPYNEAGKKIQIDTQAVARMAGWPTPNAEEARRGFQNRANGKKGSQKSLSTIAVESIHGPTQPGYLARTEKRGALNPALSRWLMGYPDGWDSCGVTAMQSCRKSRQRS